MELELVKELIRNKHMNNAKFIIEAEQAERYYNNKTDILYKEKKKDSDGNPLRSADNRVPRNFHGLLVDQKAAYMFTAPPLFDVGNKKANEIVSDVLGDEFHEACNELCVNAANDKVAWIHYWIDDAEDEPFQYAVVDAKQIIPIYDFRLKRKLIGLLREYKEIDENTGKMYIVYEYWNDKECSAYRQLTDADLDTLEEYNMFGSQIMGELTNVYYHDFGTIPFIPFENNTRNTSDLESIKALIDIYDKVYSGFCNDLEDIQEIIFVLNGYGGTDLNGLMQDIKKYKVINMDSDEDGSGVDTLSIEIPVEAREKLLDTTRKAIFEQGFGFDPRPENFGNQSGEALKFMYSQLEIKAGLTEVKFRTAFSKLVRAICKYKGIECKKIQQTWTRTSIKNDTELAEICKNSVGIVSTKTILKAHPLVDDVEEELKQIELEEKQAQEKQEQYSNAFNQGGDLEVE